MKYLIENKSLIGEWNYEKNIEFAPKFLIIGSNKKSMVEVPEL